MRLTLFSLLEAEAALGCEPILAELVGPVLIQFAEAKTHLQNHKPNKVQVRSPEFLIEPWQVLPRVQGSTWDTCLEGTHEQIHPKAHALHALCQ